MSTEIILYAETHQDQPENGNANEFRAAMQHLAEEGEILLFEENCYFEDDGNKIRLENRMFWILFNLIAHYKVFYHDKDNPQYREMRQNLFDWHNIFTQNNFKEDEISWKTMISTYFTNVKVSGDYLSEEESTTIQTFIENPDTDLQHVCQNMISTKRSKIFASKIRSKWDASMKSVIIVGAAHAEEVYNEISDLASILVIRYHPWSYLHLRQNIIFQQARFREKIALLKARVDAQPKISIPHRSFSNEDRALEFLYCHWNMEVQTQPSQARISGCCSCREK